MNDPSILFVKPKAISASDKKALVSAGIIVIEIENPADAKFVRAGAELSGSELLLCATKAISGAGYDSIKAAFANAICVAVEATSEQRGGQRE